MRFGSPLASGLGSPDNFLEYVKYDAPVAGQTFLRVRIKARANYGNAFYSVYNNCVWIANIYITEGVEFVLLVRLNYGAPKASLNVQRIGHLSDPCYSAARVVRPYEASDSQRTTIRWTWKPRAMGAVNDGGYTSNWVITGLSRRQAIGKPGSLTQMQLTVNITVSGGNCTVDVLNGLTKLATGTAAVGGAPFNVNLAAVAGSGVTLSATVNNTVVTTTGATLYVRWPKQMKIKRGLADPPSVVVDTVNFDGRDTAQWTESADLAAATYYYRITEVSDSGTDGTDSATFPPAVINGPPGAPTNLAFVSGSGGAGVTLGFTASPTGGATYRLYMGVTGSQMNLNDIKATAIAGATQIVTPVINVANFPGFAGFPATARCIVRAVNAGIEEKNINTFDLVFDAGGAYVAPAPNIPTPVQSTVVVSAGLTLAIDGTYPLAQEKGVAASLELYTRAPGGSYGAAVATVALASISPSLKSASFSYTFVSGGLYYIAMKAITAGGVRSALSGELLVYVGSEQMAPPDVSSAAVSRG